MTGSDHLAAEIGDPARLLVRVSGHVQGVGFRWWTRSRALALGLEGWAMNRDDGRVEVVAEGSRPALEALMRLLAAEAAPTEPLRPGRVDQAVVTWLDARGVPAGFVER